MRGSRPRLTRVYDATMAVQAPAEGDPGDGAAAIVWDGDFRARCLEELFHSTPDAVYVADLDGRMIAGNEAFSLRSGVPLTGLAGLDLLPAVHPDDRARVREQFLDAARGESRRYRARGLGPGGTTTFFDVSNIPVQVGGRQVGVLGIVRDIDEVADLSSTLERSTRLVQMGSRVAKLAGWTFDVVQGTTEWSDELSAMLGRDGSGDELDTSIGNFVDAADQARVAEQFGRAISDGTPLDVQMLCRRADGTPLHAHVVGEAVRNAAGDVIRIDGAFLDVSDSVRIHRERRLLEGRLAATLDGSPDFLLFIDHAASVVFANQRVCDLVRRTRDEVVGQQLWSLRAIPDYVREMIEQAMAESRRLSLVRYDPEVGWIETSAYPAGDLLAIQVRDITAIEEARRRRLDDARRIHAQSTLLDTASEAIILRGLAGQVQYWNRSASELLGTGDADLAGQLLRDLLGLTLEDKRPVEEGLSRDGYAELEFTLRRPGRDDRLVVGRWNLIRDPDGVPEAVFAVLSDVTERRQQEQVLLRTQRMESIGTLAGGISHDLNNVLTPLRLSVQLLADGETDPMRQRLLAGMADTIDRGADMIRQVLTFARGVEGEKTALDARMLAERFATFCRDTLPKEIAVSVACSDDVDVTGDATQLMQVLMNLATNARDAMPDGGSLSLTVDRVGDRVQFTVSDSGAGMSDAVAARIFEPFYTTKDVGNGTGLGLAVSQAIARSHHGTLEIVRTGEDGTTFRLDLPAALGETDPGTASSEETPMIRLDRARVLIVDDEAAIVDAASMVVARAGGIALGAGGAEEARGVLERGDVDLVVTDLVMPGTTGREFLTWLERERPQLPVVAMSGIPEQGGAAAARSNVRAALDKPFTADKLLDAIRGALGSAS